MRVVEDHKLSYHFLQFKLPMIVTYEFLNTLMHFRFCWTTGAENEIKRDALPNFESKFFPSFCGLLISFLFIFYLSKNFQGISKFSDQTH